MELALPSIEELNRRVDELDPRENSGVLYVSVLRIQMQVIMHVVQELEQINNNLEALRRGDRS